MAAPVVNLKAGATKDYGDRVGTTTHTSTQTFSGSSSVTVTDETFTNPTGRALLVTGGSSNVTFDHCTFRDVGSTTGVTTPAYSRYGLHQIENSSNITFQNCKFENIASIASQSQRNNMMHVQNVTGFTFTNCYVQDVNSNEDLPNYSNGDEGNRTFWISNNTTGLQINYSTFINPGRNLLQWLNSVTGGAGSEIHHNVCVGKAYNGSEFEDMINLYNAGGTSGAHLKIYNNYMRNGGNSASGTAVIIGDGNGGNNPQYVDVTGNVLVNPGNVGFNCAGGQFNTVDNNIIYSSGPQTTNNSVGLILANFGYVPLCDSNTISNNRIWFFNSSTGGTNNTWIPTSSGFGVTPATNSTVTGNTFGDTSLTTQNVEDVLAVADSTTVTASTPMTAFDLRTTDQSFFRDDTYTITSGTLPTGLTMSTSGVISGTPTGTSSTITYLVTNRFGRTSSATFAVTVGGGVTFGTTTPANGAVGVVTPITPAGAAPNDGSAGYEIEIYNVTATSTVSAYGAVAVTYTPGSQTWAADSSTAIVQDGSTIRVTARRWS